MRGEPFFSSWRYNPFVDCAFLIAITDGVVAGGGLAAEFEDALRTHDRSRARGDEALDADGVILGFLKRFGVRQGISDELVLEGDLLLRLRALELGDDRVQHSDRSAGTGAAEVASAQLTFPGASPEFVQAGVAFVPYLTMIVACVLRVVHGVLRAA